MSGITLTTAEARLADWLAADEAVSKSQSYSINGRSLTRADASEIRQQIDYWQGHVTRLSRKARGRSRVSNVVVR